MSDDVRALNRLIAILLDADVDHMERGEVAIALSDSDDPRVVSALGAVASDAATTEYLADTCGDALGEIWCRIGRFESEIIATLQPPALMLVVAWFERCHPGWVPAVEKIRSGNGQ